MLLNFKDDFAGGGAIGANGGFHDFNLCRIFKRCKGLRIFTVEFKDGMMVTPPVSYIGRLFNIIFIITKKCIDKNDYTKKLIFQLMY